MFLLGIDTSAENGIVCLGEGGKLIVKKIIPPYSSSQELLPSLDILIKERKIKIQDLEGIVVILGPGSFTGLRIGLSLAKSLAFALKIPLVGVPTFDVWGASVSISGVICPLLKAHQDKFYAAFYEKDKRKTYRKSKYLFLPWERIENKIKKEFPSEKITFLILEEHKNLLSDKKLGERYSFLFLEETARLRALLKGGARRIEDGQADNIFTLVPLYVSSPRIKSRNSYKK